MQDLEEANGAVAPEGGPGETKVVVSPVAVKYEEYIHSLRWEMKRHGGFPALGAGLSGMREGKWGDGCSPFELFPTWEGRDGRSASGVPVASQGYP